MQTVNVTTDRTSCTAMQSSVRDQSFFHQRFLCYRTLPFLPRGVAVAASIRKALLLGAHGVSAACKQALLR
jgi:hypothetical protein